MLSGTVEFGDDSATAQQAHLGDCRTGLSSVRVFDVAAAGLLLLVCWPMMLLASFAIKSTSRGPVLFRSERHGIGGTTFLALKLRTMILESEHEQLLAKHNAVLRELSMDFKAQDDPRVTPVGRVLRRMSLDELPQLVNVLRGQMSLVGPRPKLIGEAERYGEHFELVMAVKPGLTGSWQTSGRNSLSYDERIKLDLDYARGRTIRWDLKICLKTALQLLDPRSHGAY